jgi:hypothetical protein
MAKPKDKQGYKGYKLDGDTSEARRDRERRALARAKQNAPTEAQTNAAFALQDPAFRAACRKIAEGLRYDPEIQGEKLEEAKRNRAERLAGPRQASKYRNGYGWAARIAGSNTRKQPNGG